MNKKIEKLLIVKTSAFGDIVHTFYVIEDIYRARSDLLISWCVDHQFVELARLHPHVSEVISFPIRRWRQAPFRKDTWKDIVRWIRFIRGKNFDVVIDLQGMYKSAFVAAISGAKLRIGRTRFSSVEGMSNLVFNRRFDLPRAAGLAGRLRSFSALALGYELSAVPLFSGLQTSEACEKVVTLIIGASRPEKMWPIEYWREFLVLALRHPLLSGYRFLVLWGNDLEHTKAMYLSELSARVKPLERVQGLSELANYFQRCALVIGADTGPAHLAVAVGAKVVMLFGATSSHHNSDPRLCNMKPLGDGQTWPGASVVFEETLQLLNNF